MVYFILVCMPPQVDIIIQSSGILKATLMFENSLTEFTGGCFTHISGW